MTLSVSPPGKRTDGGCLLHLSIPAAAFLLVLAAVSAFTLLAAAGCGRPEQIDPRVQGEIEDTLEEFYESLSEGDAESLEDFITGELEDQIEAAKAENTLERLVGFYWEIEFDELDDLDIDGKDAEADVILKRGDLEYEQELELELDDDIWKISSMGKLKAAGSGDAEEALRRAAHTVLTAMKNVDPETIRAVATEDYLQSELIGYFDTIERMADDPDAREQWKQSWGTLAWEIEKIEPFEASPDMGIVIASVTRESSTIKWQLTFHLVDGEWKWANVRPAEEDEPQGQEEGETAARPQEEPRAELRQGECTNASALSVGGGIGGVLSGADKIYYKFEVASTDLYSIYASGEADTLGILLDSTCTEIEENDDDGPGDNFLIVRYLEEGTYYVAVRGFSADAGGEFRLYVIKGEIDLPPDDEAAEATPSEH